MRVYDTLYYKMFLNGSLRDYVVFSSDIAWYKPKLTDQEILDKLQDQLEQDMKAINNSPMGKEPIFTEDNRDRTIKFTSDDINMFGGSNAKNIK